jgi:hypothetical protein
MRNKQQIKAAKKLLKKPPGKLEKITLDESSPHWMTRAYKNNRYVVMINDNATLPLDGFSIPAIKAMVQRHDDRPIPNHWQEMQSIKNQIFGKESAAVEFYPKESKLVDKANIYWMWVLPDC